MACPKCGHEVAQDAVFCHRCGTRLADRPAESKFEQGRPSAPAESAAARAGADRERLARPLASAQDTAEELLWEGGFSAKAMVGSWLAAFLASAVVIVIAMLLREQVAAATQVGAALVLLFWLVPLVRLIYRKLSIRYRVTSHRLFHEEGILRRTTNRVEIIDADDVTVDRSILDRLFNVGTVRVESSDRTHPELLLVGIEAPLEVAEKIDAARRCERTRRAVHIESV